jgi:HNH endonuclease
MSGLTHSRLIEVLEYDLETGIFYWKIRPGRSMVQIGDIAGSPVKGTYWRIGLGCKSYRAHRLAWFYVTGSWPVDEIDHKDGNGFNNSWENLRPATTVTNKWNMKKPNTNASGYKGVHYNKDRNKWQASIRCGGRHPKYIGIFQTPEDAHEAWKQVASKLHGDFARHE